MMATTIRPVSLTAIHVTLEAVPTPTGDGRRCTHPDCITLLERNNPGPECHAHTLGERQWYPRGTESETCRPLPAPRAPKQPWETRTRAA